jgi:hypothetical protein
MPQLFIKDPADSLDYKFDWAAESNGSDTEAGDWLASGETIISHIITVDDGLTLEDDSLTDGNTSVTAWVSGGTDGQVYLVTCQITTNATPARVAERSITLLVRNR